VAECAKVRQSVLPSPGIGISWRVLGSDSPAHFTSCTLFFLRRSSPVESPFNDKLSAIQARIRELSELVEAEENPIKVELLAREVQDLPCAEDKSQASDLSSASVENPM
jgi:hypothetical protein